MNAKHNPLRFPSNGLSLSFVRWNTFQSFTMADLFIKVVKCFVSFRGVFFVVVSCVVSIVWKIMCCNMQRLELASWKKNKRQLLHVRALHQNTLVFTIFIRWLYKSRCTISNGLACISLQCNCTSSRHFVPNWISTNKILIIQLMCFQTEAIGEFSSLACARAHAKTVNIRHDTLWKRKRSNVSHSSERE